MRSILFLITFSLLAAVPLVLAQDMSMSMSMSYSSEGPKAPKSPKWAKDKGSKKKGKVRRRMVYASDENQNEADLELFGDEHEYLNRILMDMSMSSKGSPKVTKSHKGKGGKAKGSKAKGSKAKGSEKL